MVTDQKTGKPRGYAFLEYERERDMHCKLILLHPATPAQHHHLLTSTTRTQTKL